VSASVEARESATDPNLIAYRYQRRSAPIAKARCARSGVAPQSLDIGERITVFAQIFSFSGRAHAMILVGALRRQS